LMFFCHFSWWFLLLFPWCCERPWFGDSPCTIRWLIIFS
jgi:hypothetical protein